MSELEKVLPSDTNYITISATTNRITVRRACLEKIGSPEYIVFMMQDDGRAAGIRSAERNEDDAIHVTPSCYTKTGMFQFGGKILVGSIIKAMKWDNSMVYRVPPSGMEENTLIFEFENAVKSALVAVKNDDLGVADPEEEETTYYWKDTHKEIKDIRDNNLDDGSQRADEQSSSNKDIKGKATSEGQLRIAPDLLDSKKDAADNPVDAITEETSQWAQSQLTSWEWDESRIAYWHQEMAVNTEAAMQLFYKWRTGKLSQDEFLAHHKEIEEMESAFEIGRRVSVIRRIRANTKAFNPTIMAIIYDEKAGTCEEILKLIQRFPQASDFDIAMQVNWE